MIITIIPAAGEGKRTGLATPKQFFSIEGIPLIIYTLQVFETHPQIDEMIITTSSNYLNYLKDLISKYQFKKIKKIVLGGKTRQASVWAGVKVASKNAEIFLVHDAVRPFISAELITEIIEYTKKYHIAIPVTPVRDTLAQVKNGWIKKTIPKEELYHVQTPQGLKADLLRECLEMAEKKNLTFPDESSLVLYFGYSVKIINGSFLNFKITYFEDLLLAQKLIKGKIFSLWKR